MNSEQRGAFRHFGSSNATSNALARTSPVIPFPIQYLYNYLGYVHNRLTLRAGVAAGLPFSKADALAIDVAGVDFAELRSDNKFRLSMDPQDVAHSHMHGMCAAGSSLAMCDLKIADYREQAWQLKSSVGLARLLHLEQDSLARGHANMASYDGHVSLEHVKGDMMPSKDVQAQIVSRSAQLIRDYQKYCNQCIR